MQFLNKLFDSYQKKLALLTGTIIFIIAILEGLFGATLINSFSYYLVAFFTTLSYFTHKLVMKGFSKTPLDAQNYFMLSSSMKIVISAIVLFSYFYFVKINAKTYLLIFFILYFIYSFFEIKTLLLSLHPNSNIDTIENEKNI